MKPVLITPLEAREAALRCDDLLAAETTLKKLTEQMAAECKASMDKWPRDWMQKHVNERACLIKARQILIDRAEAETRKPCVDQGDGYWDCSPKNACVKPQSIKARINAFKAQHGIETIRSTGMSRKDHPWLACHMPTARRFGYGVTAESDLFDCVSKVGRLLDESGVMVTGEGELSAIRELCKQNNINCDL